MMGDGYMPCYEYKCASCQFADTEYQHIHDNPLVECPECHKPTYEKQVSRVHSSMREFSAPIEMFSIACNTTEEIQEMQKAGVNISDDPENPLFGVPVARSRHEKLKALKVAHFVER
jgi:putative FmdB family regulatory protein